MAGSIVSETSNKTSCSATLPKLHSTAKLTSFSV